MFGYGRVWGDGGGGFVGKGMVGQVRVRVVSI